MDERFDYQLAFSRTVGWVTREEQAILRSKRVAIAGLGGVGGSHLLTLTRLGIGAFTLAEMDHFELENFNRQAGAFLSTVGRPKLDVLSGMAQGINPELNIRTFPEGISGENLDDFLANVDLYVDSLDFFELDIRRKVFAACAEHGIPAITTAPLGMGTAVLAFLPGGMTFEQYFRLEGHPPEEQYLRFLLGLSPARLQMGYLVEPSAVDLAAHRGPSTPMACALCAGIAGTEALKILLRRGRVIMAPHGYHFDAYRQRLARTWRPLGNRNPIQQTALAVGRKRFGQALRAERPVTTPFSESPTPTALRILDLARWAPSGDNTQPWRFEIIDGDHIVVHGHDTHEDTVYDLQGHASQLSLGMLLETLSIAATQFGRRAEIMRRQHLPDRTPTFDVHLHMEPPQAADVLAPFICARTVQRRPMRMRPLRPDERKALETSLPKPYKVVWLERLSSRLRVASLLSQNSKLRLTIPEAYDVHQRIIRWNIRFSEDGIPDAALGVDILTRRLMRVLMKSWKRVDFANRYLAGTWMPRLQLDWIPGIACAAHCLIVADRRPAGIDDFVRAGRAIQRFWLTATQLDLRHQPELTPLVFSEYVRDGIAFSETTGSMSLAKAVTERLRRLVGGENAERAIWMGRLGAGKMPTSRSIRRPLQDLMISSTGTIDRVSKT
nr:ThiF family adenylyltransferase [Nitrococcus mobilis]